MSKRHRQGYFFLILFFSSGAAALIYEVVWAKMLSQMFGSTVQAQTVVLAVFMGGLALGNHWFGRRSDLLKSPVRAYGYLEIGLGIYAFLFVYLYQLADSIFVGVGSRVLDYGGALLAVKGILSVFLLLLPTVLMGGTLPLLVAWLQKHGDEPGRLSARFYSMNSLGAVLGAGMAGFYLVQSLGIVATLQATALVNVLIGGTAILLNDRLNSADASAKPQAEISETTSASPAWPWAARLVGLTGAVSMGLEVLASRSLALIFGSSLQSFAIVLMAFILGIGLGSALIASPRFQRWQSERTVIWVLWGAALWIALLIFRVETWVDLYRYMRSGLAPTTVGYLYHQTLTGAIALAVLGLPAALIGSVLPLFIRMMSEDEQNLGARVGRLLVWNTLGAVIGSLLTCFVLMPWVGLRGAFGVMSMILLLGAGFVAWRGQWRGGQRLAFSGLLALLLTQTMGGEGWRHVMSSGVFRAREGEVDFGVLERRKQHIEILFSEDAADATITVEQGDGTGAPAELGIRVNGKPDASNRGDLNTQLLLGHLPMLIRPDAEDVFVLGLGSGITAGAVLAYPVDQLVIAENCAPMVRAAAFFNPWNRGVLTNPVTRILEEDARTILKLSPQQYDVIITQPSNPWTAGIGSVFSREYYDLAASRLKEGGLMVQWFHVYEMHDQIVGLVLRTFGSVFPWLEIWDTGDGDIVLMGSLTPWEFAVDRFDKALENPACRSDLARLGIRSSAALLARRLASQQTAFAIAGEGPIQSDWFPLLEYEAPRAFFIGVTATVLSEYDERTWQADLAPLRTREMLLGVGNDLLEPVFREYGSVNHDLKAHLNRRLRPATAQTSSPESRDPQSPCVFLAADRRQAAQRHFAEETDEISRLGIACEMMREGSGQEFAGLRTFEELLRQRTPRADWSVGHYTAMAVRASLRRHETEIAARLLKLGRDQAPNDEQLMYLGRVLERWGHREMTRMGPDAPRPNRS